MSDHTPRRGFLKTLGGLAAAAAAWPSFPAVLGAQSSSPARRAGARYRGDFAAPKLDKVRVALIGVGARGSGHTTQLSAIDGTEVVGISDLYEDWARRAESRAKEKGHAPRVYFGDPNGWRTMLAETKPDAVFIATPWELHAPMGIAAMRGGAHAFIEIPIAVTLQEMWDLVDTSEQTGRHCMLMENVCYGREELLYLNMVRRGLLGELLHAEAAYIHDLRAQMKEVDRGTGSWRTYHYARRNGNLYTCHGLGPVAQYEPGSRRGPIRPSLVVLVARPRAYAVRQGQLPRRPQVEQARLQPWRRHEHVDHQDRARQDDHGPVG